jgi:hypothetical protein
MLRRFMVERDIAGVGGLGLQEMEETKLPPVSLDIALSGRKLRWTSRGTPR